MSYVARIERLESRLHLHADGTIHPESEWRVNAGGPAITLTDGREFRSEQGLVTGGGTSGTPMDVAGTSNDALYYTRRYGASFGYDLPVPNGSYKVTLYFAETHYTNAGQRTFDVRAEGQLKLNDFDIVSGIGAKRAGYRTFDVGVSDGRLDLDFAGVVGTATVSGIEGS